MPPKRVGQSSEQTGDFLADPLQTVEFGGERQNAPVADFIVPPRGAWVREIMRRLRETSCTWSVHRIHDA